MLRQHTIDERVPRIKKIEDRAVALNKIDEEPDRLFEHRLPQFVAERRKSCPIDAVVLLEAAKVEPVSGELDGKCANPLVRQHPPRLDRQNFRLMQIVG